MPSWLCCRMSGQQFERLPAARFVLIGALLLLYRTG